MLTTFVSSEGETPMCVAIYVEIVNSLFYGLLQNKYRNSSVVTLVNWKMIAFDMCFVCLFDLLKLLFRRVQPVKYNTSIESFS